MKYNLPTFLAALAALVATAISHPACASEEPPQVEVTLRPATVRSIGGVTRFNRDQFITIHESPTSTDMDAEDFRYLVEELEVSLGRDGGLRTLIMSQTAADSSRPDFPDMESLGQLAAGYRAEAVAHEVKPEVMREVVLCTHPDKFFAQEGNTSAPFGPVSMQGAAEFTAQLMKRFWDDGARPKYLEVFNEPFIKADKIGTTVDELCKQHVVVAKRVKELTPDVMVGGYTAAWPDLDARNFEHWKGWQQRFMDLAGAEMDFFSSHMYDGTTKTGLLMERTGSNSEAIIDMIDTYSHLLFGVAKPQMISEYGLIPRGNMESMEYSAERSARMLRSTNAQLMTFMDHPDRLLKAIPFFLGKALWTYGLENDVHPGHANPFLLWRRLEDGSFKKTDLVLFYQFWKGVRGSWRISRTSDPDIRCHLLRDGKRLSVVLCNLETQPRRVKLQGLEGLKVAEVQLRTLRTHGDAPVLEQQTLDAAPNELTLQAGESAILMLDTKDPVLASQQVAEQRCYAENYLEPIEAGKPVEFVFKNLPKADGNAILRLSIGREKEKSLQPEVTLNGHRLAMPTDWAGGNQDGRGTFFGMFEVPVPADLLKPDSVVTIAFPDSGGKVACAVLQVHHHELTKR